MDERIGETSTGAVVLDVLARIPRRTPKQPRPDCPVQPFVYGEMGEGKTYCDGSTHFTVRGAPSVDYAGECPGRRALEANLRVQAEVKRLRPVFENLHCIPSLNDFDPERVANGGKALEAMRRFVSGSARSVFLRGDTGNGKTHLLIASHLALLRAGVNSVYLVSSSLADLCWRKHLFDAAAREEAEKAFQSLAHAEVIHFDELGQAIGDERRRLQFTEGLKLLCDGSVRWAVGSNLLPEALGGHLAPLSDQILSRLMGPAARDGAVVDLAGADQRFE